MGFFLISQKLVGINLKIGPLMATGHKPVRYVGPGGNRCAIFCLSINNFPINLLIRLQSTAFVNNAHALKYLTQNLRIMTHGEGNIKRSRVIKFRVVFYDRPYLRIAQLSPTN